MPSSPPTLTSNHSPHPRAVTSLISLTWMSRLWPMGHAWPRIAMNEAQHKIINLLKTFIAHQFSWVFVYLMCGPRQIFLQCGPKTPKGWKSLHYLSQPWPLHFPCTALVQAFAIYAELQQPLSKFPEFPFYFDVYFAFGVKFKKLLPWLMSKSLQPTFSSRSFMVSCFMFVFNPIWVELCIWYKIVVQFHSFACGCPVFPSQLLKRLSFSHCIFLAPLI